MQELHKGYELFYAAERSEWREWLARNHATSRGIWLVAYRKAAGKPSVPYDDAVEEALCFGWIDSRSNTLDHERYLQMYTPRKAGSPWSRLNKQRVERLIQQGTMTPAGLALIEAAKRDGSWTVYDDIEDIIVPGDLETALQADYAARDNFHSFSPSSKKQLLWWIASAKRPETRAKRIAQLVENAREKRNPLDTRRTS